MASNESFGERFRRLTEAAGLPKEQEALGKKLGVSGAYINMLRNGRKPRISMKTAMLWAPKLKCTVEYLLTGQETQRELSPQAQEFVRLFEQCPPSQRGLLLQNARVFVEAAIAHEAEEQRRKTHERQPQ